MCPQAEDDLPLVYDFARDAESIRLMQQTTSSADDSGLIADPLVGSDSWWQGIATNERPSHTIAGIIEDVYWGGMGDWPEFRLGADTNQTTWTRKGDLRRYVKSLRLQLTYVEHAWKNESRALAAGLGVASRVVLRVAVEDSPLRSSLIAPGPGGVGYRLARRLGDVAHYLKFPTANLAEQASKSLEARGLTTKRYGDESSLGWFVQAWHRDPPDADRSRIDLARHAESYNGAYDGGEVVEGPVWGPSAAS